MERIKSLPTDEQLHVGAMLPIIVIIGGDISTAIEHRIYYFKPGNETDTPDGYWLASIQDAANGWIKYTTGSDDLDVSGKWKFLGWEEDASNNENYGKAKFVRVHKVGEIPTI